MTHAGNRVRVTAQLIQVSTDMHLWADAYEREVSHILDLQRSLATDIARRINVFVKPLDRAQVVKPEAYGLYLKARLRLSQIHEPGLAAGHRALQASDRARPGLRGRLCWPRRYLPGRRCVRRDPDRGGADARQGSGRESARVGRNAGQRPLRPGHGAHLVRLGLGGRGSGVSTRARAESQ